MSTATRGRAAEHKVSQDMQTRGWIQINRSAGSKGAADLVMAHPFFGAALVQVGLSHKTLGPLDRARLVKAATLCHALALLAIVTPRVGIRYFKVTHDKPSKWQEWSE